MHLTFAIYLLLTALSFASSFFTQFNHHKAPQQPLEGTALRQPNRAIGLFSYYGRCPGLRRWTCWHSFGPYPPYGVTCGCGPPVKAADDGNGLSNVDRRNRLLAEIQNVTTLEVLADIQPGNNETRVSLFDLRCSKGQHIACTQAGCGFECGCYHNWDCDSQDPHGYSGLDSGDFYEDENKCNEEDSKDEKTGVGLNRQRNSLYLSFNSISPRVCGSVTRLICCHTDFGSGWMCYCAGFGFACKI